MEIVYKVLAQTRCNNCKGKKTKLSPDGYGQEYTCPTCDGTGYEEEKVDLIKALHNLGAQTNPNLSVANKLW